MILVRSGIVYEIILAVSNIISFCEVGDRGSCFGIWDPGLGDISSVAVTTEAITFNHDFFVQTL